jgi:hypothetical protein
MAFGLLLTIDSTRLYEPFAPHLMLATLGVTQQLGRSGHTLTVQQGLSFDISVTKKQILVPGVTFPMFTVSVVDWVLCKGGERLKTC